MRYQSLVYDSARWEGFRHRPDDIVVCTPPKCGTTWMQMICALLVHQQPELPEPLSTLSPWIDMLTRPLDEVLADLEAQTHRRVIKTHTPLDGLAYDDRVTYVVVGRDPRDAALSWANHMENMDLEHFMAMRLEAVGTDGLDALTPPPPPSSDPVERFWQWIEAPTPPGSIHGLEGMLHHLGSFWEKGADNIVFFHYGDLRADLDGEMRRLAGRLGIAIDESRWSSLVDAATFERMKANADSLAPSAGKGLWRDNARFFDRARSGEWRDLIAQEDVPRYHARVGELAAPDLARWVHDGQTSRSAM